MIYLALFFAAFVQVGLKSTQQLNVFKGLYKAIMPVSMLMAAAEVYIIFSVANQGSLWASILAMGTGGGLGCISAMYIHNRLS